MKSQLSNAEAIKSAISNEKPLEEVEKILNYEFKNKNLLLQAFTDSTYYDGNKSDSYELLEYLGDTVLNTVITIEFVKLYPKESAGMLTKLRSANVDTEKLARVAVKHKLYQYLRHKKPLLEEEIMEFVKEIEQYPLHSYGRSKVPKYLADIVESTIGALFKDCNCIETVWKVIKPLLEPIIHLDKLKNRPMTELNEMCQKRNLKLTTEDTWEEDKWYHILVNEKRVGSGYHLVKKETARNLAAENALDNFSKSFGSL